MHSKRREPRRLDRPLTLLKLLPLLLPLSACVTATSKPEPAYDPRKFRDPACSAYSLYNGLSDEVSPPEAATFIRRHNAAHGVYCPQKGEPRKMKPPAAAFKKVPTS